MRLACVGVLASCWACGSTDGGTGKQPEAHSVASCRQQFSPEAGYGWDHDLTFATTPPDGGTPPPEPSPLEQTIAECEAAGQPASVCDGSQMLTHDASICVAEGLGLAAGIAPMKAGFHFDLEEQRIVWNVHNVLSDDGQGSQSGHYLTLDAITGKKLGTGSWGSMP